jgi:hypothetical protein
MMKPPFVWLGSGRTRKHDVGEKPRLLDRASSAGLPVPPGAILLDELYRLLLAEEVILTEGDVVIVPDPEFLQRTLYAGIRLPKLDRPVVVRAAFSWPEEQTPGTKDAFPQRLTAEMDQAASLANALAAVWSTVLALEARQRQMPETLRRDVLIMEMVAADIEGWAITRPAETWDEMAIRRDDGFDRPVHLPKLRPWRNPDRGAPPATQRLQRLLRGVRRTFGKRDLRIDWIDDGRICWLIQASFK